MKHKSIFLIFFGILLLCAFGLYLYFTEIGVISIPKTQKEKPDSGKISASLTVPAGFALSVFAEDLPGARVLTLDPLGNLLVSLTKEGSVVALRDTLDNRPKQPVAILDHLQNPHGILVRCESESGQSDCALYVAEQKTLSRYTYDAQTLIATDRTELVTFDSSVNDRHKTRSLLLLPDNDTLLVSIGSSCNVCHEKGMQGKIMAYSIRNKTFTEYARGLRNAVFMTIDPVQGKIFATEMGRDGLGDTVPPDELNRIEEGKNYGWPICYGNNIHDTEFDTNTYIRNPCMVPFETPSFIDLEAHSAPLGLAFIPEEGWPEDYWYDLLVAYHGSWNRSEPTGYKVVRLRFDAKGVYGGTEDFITGWLTKEGTKIGRPVDIMVFPGGTAYISDDEKGVVYKLYRTEE